MPVRLMHPIRVQRYEKKMTYANLLGSFCKKNHFFKEEYISLARNSERVADNPESRTSPRPPRRDGIHPSDGNIIFESMEKPIDFWLRKGKAGGEPLQRNFEKRCHMWQNFANDKMEQEQRSLCLVNDEFRKLIVVGERLKLHRNERGITIVGIYDFLLDKTTIDQ